MISKDTDRATVAPTTTTTNTNPTTTSTSYTYSSIPYCKNRMPCGKCDLTGEECDYKVATQPIYPSYPVYPTQPTYPWWGEPIWTCNNK